MRSRDCWWFVACIQLKLLWQLVWIVSRKRKLTLKWKGFLFLIFIQVFTPYEHDLVRLLEKWKNNFLRLYWQTCFYNHYWILKNNDLLLNRQHVLPRIRKIQLLNRRWYRLFQHSAEKLLSISLKLQNNCKLRWGRPCQVVRFDSHFSQILHRNSLH